MQANKPAISSKLYAGGRINRCSLGRHIFNRDVFNCALEMLIICTYMRVQLSKLWMQYWDRFIYQYLYKYTACARMRAYDVECSEQGSALWFSKLYIEICSFSRTFFRYKCFYQFFQTSIRKNISLFLNKLIKLLYRTYL